jgi:ferredoxin-NADP reductase
LPGQPTQLIRHETVAEDTMRFHFVKPARFDFTPGQFVELALIDPPETDAEGNSRAFSLVSAPSEPEISITTRMRDTAFKRVLKKLQPGAKLLVDGPMGDFTLHRNSAKPAVFLAGGIGITPFHSIIKNAAEKNLPHKLVLFYSNRRPEDAAFYSELQDIAAKYKNFQIVPTMTEMEKSSKPWNGERGFIDAAMLKRHLSSLDGPIFYIAGPPAMVTAMRSMLEKAQVDPDAIRSEEFSGY